MSDSFSYPIACIGLVGGGQLGRMLTKAAKRIGCTVIVLDPQPDSPAGQVAGRQIVGSFHDAAKLRQLAECCDVLTYELEHIDSKTLIALEQEGHYIRPRPQLLATIQDKLLQKRFLKEHNIPTSDFEEVVNASPEQFANFGYPLVQKTRRGGYDGRGVMIMSAAEDFAHHLPVPSLIEHFVRAEKEIAVLVARNDDGDCRAWRPVEMCFRSGENVLDLLLSPANISEETAEAAESLAIRTIEAMQGTGVFGVELFLAEDGELLVNEVAPRTHNSGHHTIEASMTDQFEQHLRAIIGLPLGSTKQLSPAAMINLLGAHDAAGSPVIKGMKASLDIPGVCVHLYGKNETTPFRKMGHVTVLDSDLDKARSKAETVRDTLIITGDATS